MTTPRNILVWLGSAPPMRSIRWLDGALHAAAKLGNATAIAAGDPTWLDLASDRATRAQVSAAGVLTDLQLDYLGWAQIAAAAARYLDAQTIIVDEASRPERFPEVAAIAEILDAAQLTHVTAIAADPDVIHATRATGSMLQTIRVRGTAVVGLRVPGSHVDEYPTPMPSTAMKRLDLATLGLDASVLSHRALPPRAGSQPRRTIERVVDHLAVHLAPRPSDFSGDR